MQIDLNKTKTQGVAHGNYSGIASFHTKKKSAIFAKVCGIFRDISTL